MNPYDVLGVSRGVGDKEIKASYRQLTKTLHPDRGGSAEAWEELTLAYEVLSEPVRRERYDLTGRTDVSSVTTAKLKAFLKDSLTSIIKPRSKGYGQGVDYNVLAQLVQDIRLARPGIKLELGGAQRELERALTLKKNFVPSGLAITDDIIGSILDSEIDRIKDNVKIAEGMLELSEAAEDVLSTYEYKAAPASEGQYETRAATARGRLSGLAPPPPDQPYRR